MALPIVHVPAGAIIRLPTGQTVELEAGEKYDAPPGTQYPTGPAGTAPATLSVESEILAQPAAGQEAPGLTGQGTPAAGPQTQTPPTGKIKDQTWESVKNGKGMQDAYAELHKAASVTLPGLHHQFMTISRRPLGG